MSAVNLLVLIIPRELTDGYSLFLRDAGLRTFFSVPCSGTASPRILSRLGLEKNEKTLTISMMDQESAVNLMNRCISDMGLNLPGNGIAMRIPVQSAGGASALKILTENMPVNLPSAGAGERKAEGKEPEEEKKMDFPCSLVVAICENGHSDTVMNAARKVGAAGGTVVHAKGTAGELARKFLGVSLANEKELVLILTSSEKRNEIMRAVMDEAGIQSEAHTVLFSLPVESVAGLKSLMSQLQAQPQPQSAEAEPRQ